MLSRRLLISAVVVPALIGLFVIDHRLGPRAWVLFGLCLLLAVRCVFEMVRLLRHRSFDPHLPLTALLTLAVIVCSWWEPLQGVGLSESGSVGASRLGIGALGPVAVMYAGAVLLFLTKGALTFREPGRSMQNLGSELLIVSYVGVLIAVTAQLRWIAGAEAGYLVLGSLVISAKCGDIGAYTLGRLFGKTKLVPRLSPAKTRVGGFGALLGSAAGAVLWLELATPRWGGGWTAPAWYWSLAYGVAIGLAGMVGDLCESLIKRDVGQKDSASLLPGFGGLLDLLDSVLYAGPVAYVLWQVMPLATWLR